MRALNIFLVILCLLTSSCDKPNVLTEYSKTNDDEALFLEAQKRMDNFEWDKAISILTTDLSADFRQKPKAQERLMHAYGGKCGISFFDMIQALKNVNSTKMFDIALKIFDQKVVNVAACDAAINVLHNLGATAAERTGSQNTFAAILGLTRMGTTIKAKMDRESSGLGNGQVDAGWNSCEISDATLRLSNADMNRVASGVGLMFENLVALGESLTSGSAGASFADAKALCETPINIPALGQPEDYSSGGFTIPPGTSWTAFGLPAQPTYTDLGLPPDFADPFSCTNTLDSAVPDKMRRLLRRLISSSSVGYGTCDLTQFELEPTFVANPDFDPLEPIDEDNLMGSVSLSIKAHCCEDLAAP